jgi:hypothetical protein
MKKQIVYFLFFTFIRIFSVSAQNSIAIDGSKKAGNDSLRYEIGGLIKSRLNDIVTVQYNPQEKLPAKNTLGNFSKYFESVIFGFKTTGWLDIADVKVISCGKGILKLKILNEKSQMLINEEKVDHFAVGNKVKFIWKE